MLMIQRHNKCFKKKYTVSQNIVFYTKEIETTNRKAKKFSKVLKEIIKRVLFTHAAQTYTGRVSM